MEGGEDQNFNSLDTNKCLW